jgi:hypothetical protein
MKCCTVSSLYWHAGQIGELVFPIRCRCLAKGACPVLSCDNMAAFLDSAAMRSRYLPDGVIGSVPFIRVYRGDLSHAFRALRLSFSLYAHFAADLLCGSL